MEIQRVGLGVAPLVGAWIEIVVVSSLALTIYVAPLVGAWIEICGYTNVSISISSLPLWERGLKYRSHLLSVANS